MNPQPNSSVLSEFNSRRAKRSPYSLCYAPFISLNFDQTGSITACCFNRQHILGTYPKQSISDAWSGKLARELRNALTKNDLGLGCQKCGLMLQENNFESVLIRHFDDHAGLSKSLKRSLPFGLDKLVKHSNSHLPVMFEFELSNSCNLECIMCGGKWSSAIRKNRENLPALKSPYDSQFVNQLKEFLPSLARANFLGGEPFLISLYYEIWDAIIEINPNIVVAITSNGTTLSDKAKKILQSINDCRITLSIDSLRKETWENIRRGGRFELLKQNMEWLIDNDKLRSLSVCPMIQNWQEVPEILQFCANHNLEIYFNIVYGPLGGKLEGVHYNQQGTDTPVPEVSLQNLKPAELRKVVELYRSKKYPHNLQIQLDHLIAQLSSWIKNSDTA